MKTRAGETQPGCFRLAMLIGVVGAALVAVGLLATITEAIA